MPLNEYVCPICGGPLTIRITYKEASLYTIKPDTGAFGRCVDQDGEREEYVYCDRDPRHIIPPFAFEVDLYARFINKVKEEPCSP